jgi:hypothetical protein
MNQYKTNTIYVNIFIVLFYSTRMNSTLLDLLGTLNVQNAKKYI